MDDQAWQEDEAGPSELMVTNVLPSTLALEEYEDDRGQRPHAEWLDSLDDSIRARVVIYLRRLETGNLSNVKAIGDGVFELRIHFGPGYRVYFARAGLRLVLLLAGGTKRRQSADIARAKAFWSDFQERSKRASDAVKPQLQRNRSRADR